jgi:hypothetical protein
MKNVKQEWTKPEIRFVITHYKKGHGRAAIGKMFRQKFGSSRTENSIRHCIETHGQDVERDLPRVLLVDIETKPKKFWAWGVWQQDLSHNMMIEEGAILSWSAKWLGESANKIMYKDQRGNEKNLLNDKKLMLPLSKLLDQADLVIWQHGDSFDYGEINNRFAEHDIEIPGEYKTIDTKKIAKRHIRLPWYSLSYMTERFNKKYKKQSHEEFPGFSLWDACMKGNRKAWNCMKKYNQFDVLSMEELFVNTLAKFAKGNARVAAAMRTYNASLKKK